MICLPIGLVFGKYSRAIVSLITATLGVGAASLGPISRPKINGTPTAEK